MELSEDVYVTEETKTESITVDETQLYKDLALGWWDNVTDRMFGEKIVLDSNQD